MGTSATDAQWFAEYSKLKNYSIFKSFDIWKFRALHFAALVPDPQAAICDYGAGEGRAIMALEKLGYSNVCALDTKNVLLEELRERIEFMEGDITNLAGVDEGRFDATYVFEALHHLPDREACFESLRAIHRTLKPGGMLFLYEPVHNLPTRIQYALIRCKLLHFIPMARTMAALLEMEGPELFTFYGYMDLISGMLEDLGFSIISECNFLNHRLWAVRKNRATVEAFE